MKKEYLSREAGLSDLLNFAHLVEEGILLNKDGAYVITYQFRGPDGQSATSSELDALTQNFSRMLLCLDDGWMVHVDEIRIPSVSYPSVGYFPDPVSRLIDAERRARYERAGQHFENLQFLTWVWKFPQPIVKTARHWFVEGLAAQEGTENLTTLLHTFTAMVERCVGLLSTSFLLTRLSSADLLSFLNTCISGELLPVALPPAGCYVDSVLGRKEVLGGHRPKVGSKHVYTLALLGYFNPDTVPGLLEEIATYPLVYRWSNRFVPLSEATVEQEIKRFERHWNNKVKGLLGLIRETFSGQTSTHVNQDALSMSAETQEAAMRNSSRAARFGYWTSNLILMDENLEVLDAAVTALARYLEQRGFACQVESVNAMEAWRGSIPGHGHCNVRRLLIDSVNLAHALPLQSIWVGRVAASPASLLPPQSPPVFVASTTGKTPFRFHIDVSDVGHLLAVGPTGSGKTFFLQFLVAQFLRYPQAQIFIFDKDYSHQAFTAALGGCHDNISDANTLAFCPLGDLSTDTQKMRAEQWIETLVSLQAIPLTTTIRRDIHTAIYALALDTHPQARTLTIFCKTVQNEAVRQAVQYYTLEGTMTLLDAPNATLEPDAVKTNYLHTFEMGWLLNQKAPIYLPILMHLFDHIESQLEAAQGSRPTLIILEEAWLYIGHDLFAAKLRDWLKTLRKKNARVVFVTQSLSDLYHPETKTLTQLTATIMESCPTKVYLPNPHMETETRDLYRKMGLNERQLEMIERIGVPKRHYYLVTPEGHRLIELDVGETPSVAATILGLSPQRGGPALLACQAQYGGDWVEHWLKQHGLVQWIEELKKNKKN